MKEQINRIKKLISIDEVEKAIDLILSFDSIGKEYVNLLIVNSSKFHELKSLERNGLIQMNNSSIEKSQIRFAILQIVDEIEKKTNKEDFEDLPSRLFSKFPLEVINILVSEKTSINKHFDDAIQNIKGKKKIKKIEKFKFLYNSLSERRFDAIKAKNLLLAKDVSSEIFTLLSIFEDDFKKEIKDFNAFNVIVSARSLASNIAGSSIGAGLLNSMYPIILGSFGIIASKVITINVWTKSEIETETLPKEIRIQRIRKIIEE